VDSAEDFAANIHRFSANQLRKISWNNVIVAGDAVLG
jgi:hypothetical protein